MFEIDPKTAQMGSEILPFEMGYLPDFFQRKAEVEIRDTPENRQTGLKDLKAMMENDNAFSGINFDEDFLLQYLRCKKFDTKKAFTQIKAFQNLHEKNTKYFMDLIFENVVITMNDKILRFLPYRCHDGCAVLHLKFDNWNPAEFPIDDVKRLVIVIFLQSLRDPMTQVNGFKVIFDDKINPFRFLRYTTPHNLYLMYHGITECFPGRFKEFHIINQSLVTKVTWGILKFFVSDKMKRRVFFHDAPEELLDYFSASIVPVEYGGALKDYDMTDWLRDVMSPEKLATIAGGNYKVA